MAAGKSNTGLNFAALDFETANYDPDSACALGVALVQNGELSLQRYLIRPPSDEFVFTYIHGFRWEDVQHAPTFAEVWPQAAESLKGVDFFAAHNASFDQGVLHACCDAYGIEVPRTEFLCTVQLARRVWDIYPTKLPMVCRALSIPLDHHEAGSDAEACARIVMQAAEAGAL